MVKKTTIKKLPVFIVSLFLLGSHTLHARPAETNAMMVKGDEVYYATPSIFPHHVYIGFASDAHSRCGGSLINDRTILTAAHCLFSDSNPSQLIANDDFIIRYNGVSLSDMLPASVAGVSYPNEVSMKYDPDTFEHDIALIHLSEPIISYYSDNDQYAKVPATTRLRTGHTLRVKGFGVTNSNDTTDELLWTFVNYIPANLCRGFAGFGDKIFNTMFCAGDTGGDACGGDSGGGVTLSGSNHVVGIVSWGYECASNSSPGVYTSVQPYFAWISDNMHFGTFSQ